MNCRWRGSIERIKAYRRGARKGVFFIYGCGERMGIIFVFFFLGGSGIASK